MYTMKYNFEVPIDALEQVQCEEYPGKRGQILKAMEDQACWVKCSIVGVTEALEGSLKSTSPSSDS